jgi:hypothetical protein
MSTQSDQYREMAAKARSEADASELPNVRQVHLRSADRLDQLVQSIENVANAKVRNEAGKAAELLRESSVDPET